MRQRKPSRRFKPPKAGPGPNDLTLGVSERDSDRVQVFYVNRVNIPGYVEQWEKLVVAVRKDFPQGPSDPRAHAIMCLRGFMDGCDLNPQEHPLVAAAYLVSRSDKSEHITGPRTMIVLEENGFEVTEVLQDEIPTIH